jgi:hypothetical protein
VRLQGPILQHELFAIRQASGPISENYMSVLQWIDASQSVMNIPTVIVWAIVGLVVYVLIVELARLFNGVVYVERELRYVHGSLAATIGDLLERFFIRLVATLALVGLASYTFGQLVPQHITSAETVGAQATAASFGQLLMTTTLLILSLLVQTGLLRLVFLRTRLFGRFAE